jgi:predicted ATP-grasp superfamily ATP-dependent carboligase
VPAGANLPHLAYLDAIGAEIPPMTVGERKVRWVDGRRDFLYWMAYRNGDHAGERLRFRDYLDSLRGPRECAFWAADDPWPLLAPSTTFPREFWQHVRRGR